MRFLVIPWEGRFGLRVESTCMHVCMCAFISVCTCVYMFICACMYRYLCVYVCVCVDEGITERNPCLGYIGMWIIVWIPPCGETLCLGDVLSCAETVCCQVLSSSWQVECPGRPSGLHGGKVQGQLSMGMASPICSRPVCRGLLPGQRCDLCSVTLPIWKDSVCRLASLKVVNCWLHTSGQMELVGIWCPRRCHVSCSCLWAVGWTSGRLRADAGLLGRGVGNHMLGTSGKAPQNSMGLGRASVRGEMCVWSNRKC